MLRGVVLLAGISAALTGLLYAATGGRLTAPGAEPLPVASSRQAAPTPPAAPPAIAPSPAPSAPAVVGSADPAPGSGSAEPPMGGPLVPLPNPLPSSAPEPARVAPPQPLTEAAATPVAPPAPALPAEASPDLRSTDQAAPAGDASTQAALPAPVPKVKPRTIQPGTTIVYDQPKAGGGPRLWTGCTKFKSYDPTSETYRGVDGQLHSCKMN
ncbi:MAG: hypothetical protein U1E62_26050 [Alsobacter sp.]